MKKRMILVLMLAAMSTGAKAEWVKIRSENRDTFYSDPSTIRKDNNLLRVWELQDLKERGNYGEMSSRALTEYNCKEGRSRLLSLSSHSGPMATGKVLLSGNLPKPEWGYIAPGTLEDAMLKFVCSK